MSGKYWYFFEIAHQVRHLRPEVSEVLRDGSIQQAPTLRVHVPNNWVLRVWAIVIVVQVLGKYMIIRYLDP